MISNAQPKQAHSTEQIEGKEAPSASALPLTEVASTCPSLSQTQLQKWPCSAGLLHRRKPLALHTRANGLDEWTDVNRGHQLVLKISTLSYVWLSAHTAFFAIDSPASAFTVESTSASGSTTAWFLAPKLLCTRLPCAEPRCTTRKGRGMTSLSQVSDYHQQNLIR